MLLATRARFKVRLAAPDRSPLWRALVSAGVIGCSDVGVGSGQLSEREFDADALGDRLFDDIGSSGQVLRGDTEAVELGDGLWCSVDLTAAGEVGKQYDVVPI